MYQKAMKLAIPYTSSCASMVHTFRKTCISHAVLTGTLHMSISTELSQDEIKAQGVKVLELKFHQ